MYVKVYFSRLEMTQRIHFWHQIDVKNGFSETVISTLEMYTFNTLQFESYGTFLFFNTSWLTPTVSMQMSPILHFQAVSQIDFT